MNTLRKNKTKLTEYDFLKRFYLKAVVRDKREKKRSSTLSKFTLQMATNAQQEPQASSGL